MKFCTKKKKKGQLLFFTASTSSGMAASQPMLSQPSPSELCPTDMLFDPTRTDLGKLLHFIHFLKITFVANCTALCSWCRWTMQTVLYLFCHPFHLASLLVDFVWILSSSVVKPLSEIDHIWHIAMSIIKKAQRQLYFLHQLKKEDMLLSTCRKHSDILNPSGTAAPLRRKSDLTGWCV